MLLTWTRTLYLILISSLPFANAAPLGISLEPLLKVNYKPSLGTDEGGFWYQVEKLEQETKRSPYRITDPAINQYLEKLVCDLAGEYCASIRVYLIDNPGFNASMYPNGMMHIWSGLLLRVENEAQLAAILGHEIGHYLMTHQLQRYRNVKNTTSFSAFLDVGIAALTGIHGLGTLAMLPSVYAFSRDQEHEADTIGLELMALRGYDPIQASKVWEGIIEEREADQSKESPSLFWQTHPSSNKRADKLRTEAQRLSSLNEHAESINQAEYIEVVSQVYPQIMANHISLQEYEQAEVLLHKHETLGYSPANVSFFLGELYRLRGQNDDIKLAMNAYQRAISFEDSPAEAHKQLGYLFIKENKKTQAFVQFQRYLEKNPDATDKAMINYYLTTLR
ncbi:M48 family metallopeptidase [Alteromonas sp. a30]|uniref:M48 family metallopeptidase n=1 Tax=Alteromonas sp. a30 TaxID=2730917 RepID=UPI00227F6E41|nr:M48 family metallopeptidase [Alteromonas sp. a30]MCY7294950.1 M48 family metalloprotease [Alteromonas sp. a30]